MSGRSSTAEWLLGKLDLHAQLELRRVLRELDRRSDARMVSVWVIELDGTPRLVEYAGDDAVRPRALPRATESVPSYATLTCRGGEAHEAVVHRVRLGRGMPSVLLVLVDAHLHGPGPMKLVEDYGERVEQIIVDAVEPRDG